MLSALSGLTTRGRCLLAAGLAAALCAIVLNERDLLRVSVFVIALPLLVATFTAIARVGVRAERQVLPHRVAVGARAEVALIVHSAGRVPTGGLLLQDGVPYMLGSKPRFFVEHLGRHGGAQLRYPIAPSLRGVHVLGPLRATVTDPFGVAEFDRELAGTTRVVVVPRTVPLSGLPGGSGLGSGDDGSVRMHAGQGEDDAVVRPYRQGDDLRKVHWRSTAKRDEMMVRVEERPWRGGTTVLLDHRAVAHRGTGATASLEWAVSLAASICVHLHRYGHRVRLVTENGRMLAGDPGEGSHGDFAVLDALAALEPTHRREFACGADPGHGQELIAIIGGADADAYDELVRFRGRGARSLAVVMDVQAWGAGGSGKELDADRGAGLLSAAGWGTTVARPDLAMPLVWGVLCRSTGQRGTDIAAGVGL
ncbi:uncharacterized protein (DUF58 family) [Herbihabitans rhizosphaerae]|uniref:Uncharacterized protein (DUF58 family) n=1 Tax=Herbihabitans rhizosphaerae TaxID=1872711 RepID=A0A4Q7KIN3_9PSEU|nr:DUF58 domain-containing protein [Herbihabitans rhizosphaerae]RZS34791.1 uncharacterized protein (DUF58 family) [Herbihabitans rhizosphaerae]